MVGVDSQRRTVTKRELSVVMELVQNLSLYANVLYSGHRRLCDPGYYWSSEYTIVVL